MCVAANYDRSFKRNLKRRTKESTHRVRVRFSFAKKADSELHKRPGNLRDFHGWSLATLGTKAKSHDSPNGATPM